MTRTHTDAPCCDEYAAMQTGVSRRGLVKGALALAGATTVVGNAVVTASPAAAAKARSVLVVVSLRGGTDGLSPVVPHADPVYYRARPRIGIPSSRLLHKDAMFALHPSLEALSPLWEAGQVAAVHATGLPVANRSHFAAMEEVEDADPGSTARVGWLNRLVNSTPGSSPLQGFGVGGVLPTSLYGPARTMSSSRVDEGAIPGADEDGRARSLPCRGSGTTRRACSARACARRSARSVASGRPSAPRTTPPATPTASSVGRCRPRPGSSAVTSGSR